MKMKINEIRVLNYRNLEDASLKVKDLAVIVGPNNSGKSNFFGVIAVLRNLYFRGKEGKERITGRFAKRYIETPNSPQKPISISLTYTIYASKNEQIDGTYLIEMAAEDRSLKIKNESLFYKSSTATGPAKKFFDRQNETLSLRLENEAGKSTFKEYSVAADVSAIEIIQSIFPDPEKAPEDYIALMLPILALASAPVFKPHNLSNNYIREIGNILPNLHALETKSDPRYRTFKKSLSEILNLEELFIHKVEVPSMGDTTEEKYLYICFVKEKYKNGFTPINDMSDGTRLLFQMLYHLFVSNEFIVFIDEPEIGLHPNAISKLFDLLQSGVIEKQVVVSTHSSFLLNLVNPNIVTLAEPDESGLSTFKPVIEIEDLQKRLKSKYVNFGDLFVNNFKNDVDTSL